MAGHCVPAVVALGQVGVVGATHQPDVRHAVFTAKPERASMVELEPMTLRTPSTLFVLVAASVAVALPHGTPDDRGDVARGGRDGARGGDVGRSGKGACLRPRLRVAFAGGPRPRVAT